MFTLGPALSTPFLGCSELRLLGLTLTALTNVLYESTIILPFPIPISRKSLCPEEKRSYSSWDSTRREAFIAFLFLHEHALHTIIESLEE